MGRRRGRVALRARGLAHRRRGPPPRLQHLPAEPRYPDAAGAAVGPHVLAGAERGPPGDGRAHRHRSPGEHRPARLLRGRDPFAGAAGLPGRRRRAGRRHARQAQEVRAVPARVAHDGFAGPPAAGGASGPRRPGLRPARAVRRAGSRRPAPGARHPQVAARSGRAAGLLDDRGVHAGRQRGGRQQLSRARRGRPVAHPRRARSHAASKSSRRWPSTTASRSTSTTRARPRG